MEHAAHESPDFERLLADMRPMLHRYCARMTGSVIDGEDVVQDALLKAFAARESVEVLANPRAWLVRIAHNTALDFLRRRARGPRTETADALDMMPAPEPVDPEVMSASLRSFLRLPTLPRAAVILKDVLGHSLEEVASITGSTPAAAKSALQRGRHRLREMAKEPEDLPLPTLSESARARLAAYVDGFKTGDFDAVREMLVADVELDLVARFRKRGKGMVGTYFSRYASAGRWAYAAGMADGLPAMLVYDRQTAPETCAHFVALEFDGEHVSVIRDFLFARYAMDGVELRCIDP